MLEVSSSTVAWISVVVVQFLIHYFILGARRERIRKEPEVVLLEENLSLSTNEGIIESDLDFTTTPDTPTAAPVSFPVSSLTSPTKERNAPARYDENSSSLTERKIYIRLSDSDVDKNTPLYLMQTGNEMLKSCSLKNMVEEQIRSVPQ
mmetsp:Transcript_10539/g.24974  ORF Transcript_10539/g.24974 Transcript_10539/m.24974 type:complete len:149 (+) Transcript_10539:171-617(+)|eukprot:CAMPEP_0172403948 /NCGR_PEP_ID=MMETSP1061-20121228/61239_1 /TAXON_ID=37318 /ORGANISM="Pseudo-nitzschia pungens, Strain cf. pungens" /LENGTH=148 /DNA_ID=CAMNT_0013138535 /DNA_START=99 /DNA_END=545 /DNA_ORIENTATION=+